MKKLITIALTAILTLSSLYTNAEYLHTEITTERVAGGITYEQRNILTDDGWIRAYIAYIDLTNPNTAVKVMTSSEGCSYLSTVQQMAYDNNTSVAVNGDFFNMGSTQTNMLGMVYKNGELISTPALDNQASFVLTDSNQVVMDYFTFEATVTSPQGYSCPVYQVNKKPVDTGMITMLTSEWAPTTWGANNLKELVVENDVVVQINEPGSGASKMPENGYILVVNPAINGFFDNFQIGDTVNIEFRLSPNIENIKEATGGNTLIVDNGKTAKFTGNVTGYAQRTAIGMSEDGKTLILAATDGRQSECKGLTQYGMAELMISIGAHKAINLDGGGSTTFVKKDASGNQQTQNSVSSLRKVSTAIGVVDNKLSGSYAASGTLDSDKTTVLVGDSVNLSASFYDEYGNSFYADPLQIRYFDSENRNMENAVYIPDKAGEHTLYAQYGDVTVSKSIRAVDDVFAIEIAGGASDMNVSSEATLTVKGYTAETSGFFINPKLINWYSSNPEIEISNGIVKASGHTSGTVTAELNGKSDSIVINKSDSVTKAPLSVRGGDETNGVLSANATVAVTGQVPQGATLLNTFFARKRLDSLKKYSYSYLIDNYHTASSPLNSSIPNAYSTRTFDSATFITLDSNAISASNLAGIHKIANGASENIVIISREPYEKYGKDGKTLKTILEKSAASGKSIFWVCGGNTTDVTVENNIRYITTGTVADYKTSSYATDADYCSYVLFTINGSEMRYTFMNDIY